METKPSKKKAFTVGRIYFHKTHKTYSVYVRNKGKSYTKSFKKEDEAKSFIKHVEEKVIPLEKEINTTISSLFQGEAQ